MRVRSLLALVMLMPAMLPAQAECRRSLFGPCAQPPAQRRALGEEAPPPDYANILSIGTLGGVSWAPRDKSTYSLENGVVKFQDQIGRFQPVAMALPSVDLFGSPGRSLSFIVPFSLTSNGDKGAGVGLSMGVSVRKSFELGIAGAAVWSNVYDLTPQQKASLTSQTPCRRTQRRHFRSARSHSWRSACTSHL